MRRALGMTVLAVAAALTYWLAYEVARWVAS